MIKVFRFWGDLVVVFDEKGRILHCGKYKDVKKKVLREKRGEVQFFREFKTGEIKSVSREEWQGRCQDAGN